MRSSSDPDVALWVFWAGKESIYKSASKALGKPPVFHHPLFRVAFQENDLLDFLHPHPDLPTIQLEGQGAFGDLSFRLQVRRTVSSVHAVSWIHRPEKGNPEYLSHCRAWDHAIRGSALGMEERFSPLEWACVTHRASALTRIFAREALAEALGVSEGLLEIRCGPGSPGRRIPSVWQAGNEIAVDLSLSHHGRFLAWAFLARHAPNAKPTSPG